MIEFILFIVCNYYPVVISLFYIILIIEGLIVHKYIWEPGRKRIYFVIFLQGFIPLSGFLLYRILPGSINCAPSLSVNDRHINTAAAVLLLFIFVCFIFVFTFYRERKKNKINIVISDKARRLDKRKNRGRL
jgi:hypothetical protein